MTAARSHLVRVALLAWFVALGSWSPCRATITRRAVGVPACCHHRNRPTPPQHGHAPADCVHCGTADQAAIGGPVLPTLAPDATPPVPLVTASVVDRQSAGVPVRSVTILGFPPPPIAVVRLL